jgi:hypothetical protein
MFMFLDVRRLSISLSIENEGGDIVLTETGPPTAEALIQGVFALQRKVRRNKGLRMWYRK